MNATDSTVGFGTSVVCKNFGLKFHVLKTATYHNCLAASVERNYLDSVLIKEQQMKLVGPNGERNTTYFINCRAMSLCGADATLRNVKGKTPRMQAGLDQAVVSELLDAEELTNKRKWEKRSKLWDDKMKATQTSSACQLGCV